MEQNKKKPIYAIAGPTASGKTELAVKAAKEFGGEVINCDSVQIYELLWIATAKPTEEEMGGITHHLLDYVDPSINYTAADWARDAAEKIAEIEARGKTPILAGGTGFYLRTLMNPLFESPKTDENLRERLRKIRDTKGPEHLHRMLERIDPELAATLFPRDYVRVMRGLEVYFQTGEKLSERQKDRGEPPEFAARIRIFVLNPPRELLYERINARTQRHFDEGLVDEVRRLLAAGVPEDTNAMGSHGYRRVCEYLAGKRTLDDALKQSQQDVRNYSKRQITWFRREQDVIWLNGFGDDPTIFREFMNSAVADIEQAR